jgi:hypothetical protein
MPAAVEFTGPENGRQASPPFQENDFAEDELGLLLAVASAIPSFGDCWQSWKAEQAGLSSEAEGYLDDLAGFVLRCPH